MQRPPNKIRRNPGRARQERLNFLVSGILLFALFEQCETKPDTNKPVGEATIQATRFDRIIQKLKSNSELLKSDLPELKIDTTYANASGETSYCEKTVQLNDSIFYSFLHLADTLGTCSHTFVVTINEKRKTTVASKYVEPDCDIDYSSERYELYDHRVISRDSILLTSTTVIQKKNSTSPREEDNIDHKDSSSSYIVISPSGHISFSEHASTMRQDNLSWLNDFRAFRDAVFLRNKTRVKTFIDFPIMNESNEIWYLVSGGYEKKAGQFSDKTRPFTASDFDKYFDKLFSKRFINSILKIKSEELYKNGEYETVELKEGNATTYKMYATVYKDKKALSLHVWSNTVHKDENGEVLDGGEYSIIYNFTIAESGQLKFVQVRLAG
jgi:hypothetical protein